MGGMQDRELTPEEKRLRGFMRFCAVIYFTGALLFLFAGGLVFEGINQVSAMVFGAALPPAPPRSESFWLTLSVAMMSTITACSALVWKDVRSNILMCAPVMASKLTSTVLGLAFTLTGPRYLIYPVIALTDFPLFVATWLLFRAARRSRSQ